jgi:septum formation protein
MELILASSSPQRQSLLTAAGYRFRIVPPRLEAECGICSGESPAKYAARMASQKAADVAPQIDEGLLIACDTVAECNGQLLGKPDDEEHARQMLHKLRGRRHFVHSGLCVWRLPMGRPQIRIASTTLTMDAVSDEQIEEYLTSGLWEGKSGSFGYQDRVGWLHIESGSESNVIGLPLELLAEMIAQVTDSGPQG